jgi:hypothetical protein
MLDGASIGLENIRLLRDNRTTDSNCAWVVTHKIYGFASNRIIVNLEYID